MTVRELIEILTEMDQNKTVQISDDSGTGDLKKEYVVEGKYSVNFDPWS